MMLGLTPPDAQRPFKVRKNEFGDDVLVDSTGRIIAGDPGQLSIWDFLQNAISTQTSATHDGPLAPNYAAYAALALVAFLALRGLR
jgi:hypothetical protein